MVGYNIYKMKFKKEIIKNKGIKSNREYSKKITN